MTIQQSFDLAVQHHQAGRLPLAEQLYRQILSQEPNHADALHLLGVIAAQVGRNDVAVELIRRAIALRPNWPEAYSNLGAAECANGQIKEAIVTCRQAIALDFNFPKPHNNLGNALKGDGRLDEAIAAYRQAIALNPSYPEAHSNLGVALKDQGRIDDAVAAYRQAIRHNPSYPEAHNNLGVALNEQRQLNEAIAAYRRAISFKPDYAEAHSNLGVALKDQGRIDEAIAAYRQAISLKPGYAEAHNNLGLALKDQGQVHEAIAAYRQAIALKPGFPDPHNNISVALCDIGQPDEAIAACRRAIALKSDFPIARGNLAFALLLRGDFTQGWNEYEWRWKCKDFSSPLRSFPQPQWDGRPLAGATILVHAEQGFGDTIQFIRYLPLVAQRGGKVIFECQRELQRLAQSAAGDGAVVAQGQPLPAFDVHCPLLSLPRLFETTLESIPHDVPYLYPDPENARKWQERLALGAKPIKVGLAWAGRRTHKNDRNRSMALSDLVRLFQLKDVSFYNLQKGESAEQVRNRPRESNLIDWTDDLTDFSDTASMIASLDLVISVDTAVAHLAGAIGKPVWLLVPFAPDWRWMMDREDSPWYPTMRLFRQNPIGDWDSVIQRVGEALTRLSRMSVKM